MEVLKPSWRITANYINVHLEPPDSKLTYEIGLLKRLSKGGRKNIASFVGVCTTVRTDSNDRGVRVFAVGTLDISCGPFSVNYKAI